MRDDNKKEHTCEVFVLLNRRYNSREYIKCTPENYLLMKRWEEIRTRQYIEEFIASLRKKRKEHKADGSEL